METREDGRKLMWWSRPQLRTFILFPAAKGGGGEGRKEQERAKRRRPSLGRGQERGLLKNEIVSSVRIYLQWS